MEQKDYILREIEKIGMIISFIRQKFFSGKGNLSISIEEGLKDVNGMLLAETNFDLNRYLSLNVEESNEYISNFKGFSVENMEQLAGCISQIGLSENSVDSKRYLEKALQLYELCNLKSKTYSLERDKGIIKIKNAL